MREQRDKGPAAVRERVLAPDLARGAMLLLIVLAHAPLYLTSIEPGTLSHPTGGSVADQVVRSITMLAVDSRAYPMFAALFGYGIVMMIAKQQAKGEQGRLRARGLLRRRGWWLIAFGLAHAMLITPIEILGAYGLALLLFGWAFFRKERTLLISTAVLSMWFLAAITLFSFFGNLPTEETGAGWETFSPGHMGYDLGALIERLVAWTGAVLTNNLLFPIVVAMLLGGWAAKRRVLEDPEKNRHLLVATASIGVTVGLCGAAPMVLIDLDQVSTDAAWIAQSLHMVTGVFAGLGYTAIFGLLGARLQGRGGKAVGVLAAVGQRSLSCYLIQSALLVILLSQTFIGLGAQLNSAGAALVAVAAWLGGVATAGLLDRARRPGPAETLLRRLINRTEAPAAIDKPMRSAR